MTSHVFLTALLERGQTRDQLPDSSLLEFGIYTHLSLYHRYSDRSISFL